MELRDSSKLPTDTTTGDVQMASVHTAVTRVAFVYSSCWLSPLKHWGCGQSAMCQRVFLWAIPGCCLCCSDMGLQVQLLHCILNIPKKPVMQCLSLQSALLIGPHRTPSSPSLCASSMFMCTARLRHGSSCTVYWDAAGR